MRTPLKQAIYGRDHAVVKLPYGGYAVAALDGESEIWETVTVQMTRAEAIEWLAFWRSKVLELMAQSRRPAGHWCCPACGSADVQMSAWVTANGEEIVSAGCDGPVSTFWCDGCESEQKGLEYVKEEK